MNLLPALVVVAQRPRELTRAQLKKIKLALDEAGYSEINLRTAWREWKNQDIAATIIGFIRNRTLGAPLLPYAQRVEHALQAILALWLMMNSLLVRGLRSLFLELTSQPSQKHSPQRLA